MRHRNQRRPKVSTKNNTNLSISDSEEFENSSNSSEYDYLENAYNNYIL